MHATQLIKEQSKGEHFVTRKQARERYFGGICSATLKRWEAKGKLPPVTRISKRIQGWNSSALDDFLVACKGGSE